MGCGSSKQSSAPACDRREATSASYIKRDAERWQRRKKNNFKDSGLQRHIDACVEQKEHLKHVEPGLNKKNKKIKKKGATIQPKNDRKQVGTKNPGVGGLTQNELQAKRKNLRHVR